MRDGLKEEWWLIGLRKEGRERNGEMEGMWVKSVEEGRKEGFRDGWIE